MKIREKKYLFEGFLNVLLVALVALVSGFVMGGWLGLIVGMAFNAKDRIDMCMKYAQYPIVECASFNSLFDERLSD